MRLVSILKLSICRELSWPIEGPNIGSIPKFQVETSRVLVLTTTANAEDILLVIKMDNTERRTREKHDRDSGSVLVPESEDILSEMESIQFESAENIVSLEYSEATLEVIENDLEESHHYQVHAENVVIESSREQTAEDIIVPSDARDEDGLENISLTFKLSLNCNNGNVVCEIDSDSELEESDSEYTFTYEEVTDSECEDC